MLPGEAVAGLIPEGFGVGVGFVAGGGRETQGVWPVWKLCPRKM